MAHSQTNASRWVKERAQTEADRMVDDFYDRGLDLSKYEDRREMAEEIAELVIRKRWKRA